MDVDKIIIQTLNNIIIDLQNQLNLVKNTRDDLAYNMMIYEKKKDSEKVYKPCGNSHVNPVFQPTLDRFLRLR